MILINMFSKASVVLLHINQNLLFLHIVSPLCIHISFLLVCICTQQSQSKTFISNKHHLYNVVIKIFVFATAIL